MGLSCKNLDAAFMDIPERRHRTGRMVVVSCAWLGRLLGLGPRGKRLVNAMVALHRILTFCDDTGRKKRHENMEHIADISNLFPSAVRNFPNTKRNHSICSHLCQVTDRNVFSSVYSSNSGCDVGTNMD